MGDNNTNAFFKDGKRFSLTDITLSPEQLDEKAGEYGYPDFASFQAADPAGAQAVLAAAGMATPEDSGQVQTQVAQHDDLNKWVNALRYLPLAIGAGYGAVGLAGMLGSGAGAGAAASGTASSVAPTVTSAAAPAITSTVVPTVSSVTPTVFSAAAPTVTSAGAGVTTGVGGAAKGLASKFGSGGAADFALKTGSGIANAVLQNSQNNKQLALQREQLAQQQRQFEAQMGQRQGEQASAATQMNPFTQAQARQKQALLASLLGGYTPTTFSGGKISGGAGNYNASTFAPAAALMTPEAMQANEEQFTQNQQGATGGRYQGPDYNKVGYGALANLLSKLGR